MVKNLKDLFAKFQDEDKCREFLIQQRWNSKPVCPYCGNTKIYTIENGNRFKCGNPVCYKKFSVTVGTVFHASNVPLTTWFPAMYIIASHKKGISSVQLGKDLGVTQKTAWFMLHRIRKSLRDNHSQLLTGIVEIDETYMAKKFRSEYQGLSAEMVDKIEQQNKKKHTKDKGAVIGIKQRDGDIIVRGATNAAAEIILGHVQENVAPDAKLMTDDSTKYRNVFKDYNRQSVNHSKHEWVRGEVSTNGVENFWSVMKRGIYGIYHQISYKHLQQYCNEFSYRYNSRKMNDGDRFSIVLQGLEGKLTYKQLIQKDAKASEEKTSEQKA